MREIVIILSVSLLFSGCRTCKWFAENCPVVDSTVIVTEEYHDTVMITIPGDSIFVPIATTTLQDIGLVTEEAGRAEIKIRYLHDTLFITAKCSEDSLQAIVNALRTTTNTTKDRVVYEDKEVVVYRARKIHKIALWIVVIGIIIGSAMLYMKIRMGGVNTVVKKLSDKLNL